MVVSILLAILALITFLFLNSRFEGPDPLRALGSPFELTAKFENTKKLPTKQPVLYKGISIGRVNRVDWDPVEQVSVVTFTLDDDFEIREGAVLQIGERSLLGDPYLNLLSRGSEGGRQLVAGDEVVNTEPSVNFDEALDFLDEEARAKLRSLIHNVAEGAAPAGNAESLNGTVGGVSRTIRELNDLTGSLHDQEEHIAGLVSSAGTVLSEIGSREDAVRTIVGSGRVTLDALAANEDSLRRGIRELPLVLASGRRSLEQAQPLLTDARPLAAKVRKLAPDVRRAFAGSGQKSATGVVKNLTAVVKGLPALRRQAEPVLGKAAPMLNDLVNLVLFAGPTARVLTPALDYLTPRVEAISALYAIMAAATKDSDDIGHFLRVGFELDLAETTDNPQKANCDPKTQNKPPNQGFCRNAYPGPGDSLDPQPFESPYPRILPCTVPARDNPTKPCK
jgi:virulence factor Mce-like protein